MPSTSVHSSPDPRIDTEISKDDIIYRLQEQVQDLIQRMQVVEGELNVFKQSKSLAKTDEEGNNNYHMSDLSYNDPNTIPINTAEPPPVTKASPKETKTNDDASVASLFGRTMKISFSKDGAMFIESDPKKDSGNESRLIEEGFADNVKQDGIPTSENNDCDAASNIESQKDFARTRKEIEDENEIQDEVFIENIFLNDSITHEQDNNSYKGHVGVKDANDATASNVYIETRRSTSINRKSAIGWSSLYRSNGNMSATISNTETVHMYAIAAFADALKVREGDDVSEIRRKKVRSWMFAILSLFLAIVQLLVLQFVIYESSTPPCSSHSSCHIGQFCYGSILDINPLRQPRCLPCELADTWDGILGQPCDNIDFFEDPFWEVTDIDQTFYWIDKSGASHYNRTFVPEFNHTSYYENIFDLDDETMYEICLSKKYCEDTLPYPEAIDQTNVGISSYLKLLTSELSVDQGIILFFVAILFGSTISSDLHEASIENTVLNVIYSNLFSNSIPLKLIRLSLRIRQLVLPWFVGGATVAVMLTDNLSAKNVLLNFLAVCFLVEADNMLGKILFSNVDQEFVEEVLFSDDSIYLGVVVPSISARVLGFAVSLGSLAVVWYIMVISVHLGSTNLSQTIQILLTYGVNVTLIVWILGLVYKSTWKNLTKFQWTTFLMILLELVRCFSASLTGSMCGTIPRYTLYRRHVKLFHLQLAGALCLLLLFALLWVAIERSYRQGNQSRFIQRVFILVGSVVMGLAYILYSDVALDMRLGIVKALKFQDKLISWGLQYA